jgi:hypothetical protein
MPPDLEQECFFIAPIGDEGSDIRDRSNKILTHIVRPAAESLNLTTVRADEIASPGQITLQVIEHVLKAKAAVADLTGRNPNVFYELAVRHVARLPVALIVANDDPPLPFDIAQMRTIPFDYKDLDSAARCREKIIAHLKEAIRGAVDSPITTAVDFGAMQRGNPLERSIAEVVTGLNDLAGLQRETKQRLDQLVEAVSAEPSASLLARRPMSVEQVDREVELREKDLTLLRHTQSVLHRMLTSRHEGEETAEKGQHPLDANETPRP